MRIEICGGIGAGKTTLAKLLKRIEITPVIENFEMNPFWEAFYANPGKYTFETELTFMLQHYHQIKRSSESLDSFVCDFSLAQDLAYAKIGLKGSQLTLFEELHQELEAEVGPPHIVVLLSCDTPTMIDRIKARGRDVEQNITAAFLDSLTSSLNQVLEQIPSSSEFISINSAKVNFAQIESDILSTISIIQKYLKT